MSGERTLFITGFPGFIAERLVERLAAAHTHLFLLVQPEFVKRSVRVVERIAETTGVPVENFAIFEGDITLPELGLTAEDAGILREAVTDVFHLAAIYDLAVSREAALKVNLEGTKNVNSLVASLPNLIRYNYVSTCYVAGKRQGVIREDELVHDAGFRNFYEESKYLAECEVEKLKSSLPVTIFRPSVVVGDSKTGETTKYDGIYYLIQYLRKAPGLLRLVNVGNENVRLNLVPIDHVVNGMAALAFDHDALGKTVALADPAPLTTARLFDAIAKELSGSSSIVRPPAALVEGLLMLPFSPSLDGLPHSGVPYFFLSQTYDTEVAESLLASHDIACPGFADYVKNLLKFVEMHPQL